MRPGGKPGPVMKPEQLRAFSVPTFSSEVAPAASTALDRWALARIQRTVASAPIRFALWDGFELPSDAGQPVGTILFKNRRALFSWVWDPDLNFGEAYMFGAVEIRGDLVALLSEIYRALGTATPRSWWLRQRSNDVSAARENVHQHYDLGNEFYRLWLDREMVYTCAYFPEPDCALEEAQIAKMDLVCRKLGLRPGERVIEAGCGWGSLALFMAREYGVTVRAFNISAEQIAYARDRAKAERLLDRVEFVEGDYREVRGEYDAFVSVGMLEHVGLADYPTLGGVIDRSLTGSGPRSAAFHRPEPAGPAEPVDPEADFSGRVSADPGRGVRKRPRALGPVGARRREPAAALRGDARALAAAVRRRRRRGGEHVRRRLRPRLAALSGRVAGGVRHRHDAAVPGGVCARGEQRDSVDTTSSSTDGSAGAMDSCDALIVGGGPAGSTCAWKLRQAGLDVMVMDAAVFPRDKLCAGWITPPVVAELDLDPEAYRQGRRARITDELPARPDVPADHRLPCRAHRRPR